MSEYVDPEYIRMLLFCVNKENNIIKINNGRQRGHTTAIIELANEDDVVVTSYPAHFNRMYTERHGDQKPPRAIHPNSRIHVCKRHVRYVFIDNASSLTTLQKQTCACLIYMPLLNPEAYIFLG